MPGELSGPERAYRRVQAETVTLPDDLIIDQYTPLAYKAAVGNASSVGWNAPIWAPADQRRRLAYYRVCAALLANAGRVFGRSGPKSQAKHREYGDAAVLRDRIRSGVLGDDWAWVIEGADTDLPDEPDLPEPPPDPAPDAPPAMARVAALRRARYETEVETAIQAWVEETTAQPGLRRLQDQLRKWVDDEGLNGKLVEGEDDAVGVGDAVWIFWPKAGDWPTVTVHEPDGYFPVLPDDGKGEFPRTIHFAYQYERTVDGKPEKRLRRMTWQLVTFNDELMVADQRGVLQWVPGSEAIRSTLDPELNVDGLLTRTYPWDDTPSAETCVYTQSSWAWDDMGTRKADDLDESRATVEVDRTDLYMDFIPVLHGPNTPASKAHFGQSSIAIIAQLLDDIAEVDTDTMDAARKTATPLLAAFGFSLPDGTVAGPGTTLSGLPVGGSLDSVDLSNGVGVLQALAEDRRNLASINGRVPASLMGRVDAATATGISMLLDAAPFAQLLGPMRMARETVDRLFPKFAIRMAQVQGAVEPGPTPPCRIQRGAFLPMDQAGTATQVAALLQAGAISAHTAVMLLIGVGFDIDDAKDEVDRIRRDDAETAYTVSLATGSKQAAIDRLGLDGVTPDSVPAPTVRPAPTTNPVPPIPPPPAV